MNIEILAIWQILQHKELDTKIGKKSKKSSNPNYPSPKEIWKFRNWGRKVAGRESSPEVGDFRSRLRLDIPPTQTRLVSKEGLWS